MNLLFQVDNNSFDKDITSKPYSKYEYQAISKGPKTTEKRAFLKAINGSISDYLYDLYPLNKRSHCFFYLKKTNFEPLKEQEPTDSNFKITFKLEQSNLNEVLKSEQSKQRRFRGKNTQ
jgi:hypothetical protein